MTIRYLINMLFLLTLPGPGMSEHSQVQPERAKRYFEEGWRLQPAARSGSFSIVRDK